MITATTVQKSPTSFVVTFGTNTLGPYPTQVAADAIAAQINERKGARPDVTARAPVGASPMKVQSPVVTLPKPSPPALTPAPVKVIQKPKAVTKKS